MGRKPAGDQARLVGVQLQAEPGEPLAQLAQELLGLVPMLESHGEVVGKARDDHVAAGRRPSPPLAPEVEQVVEVDIGQEGADAPSLHRARLHPGSLPILQHVDLQPLLNEAHDAPIRDPVLEEFPQPSVVQGIEESPEVAIEHPVHSPVLDSDRQGVEPLMGMLPRPEPVGEAEKVGLVDRVPDLDDGALDDLVLQCTSDVNRCA